MISGGLDLADFGPLDSLYFVGPRASASAARGGERGPPEARVSAGHTRARRILPNGETSLRKQGHLFPARVGFRDLFGATYSTGYGWLVAIDKFRFGSVNPLRWRGRWHGRFGVGAGG